MHRMHLLSIALLICAAPAPAAVDGDQQPRIYTERDLPAAALTPPAGKAVADTFLLMGRTGSGAPYVGDFEFGGVTLEPATSAGWSSLDVTETGEPHMSLSSYQQPGGDTGVWCGELLPACGAGDVEGGYGNLWHEMLEYRLAVPDPQHAAVISIQADLRLDTEVGYDYVYLSSIVEGVPGYVDHGVWDGQAVVAVDAQFSYLPEQYLAGGEIVIGFRFESDMAWSDEDCSFFGAGAFQVDDIAVSVTNGPHVVSSFADFESGWGDWQPAPARAVGDFTRVWAGLEDVDPCSTNYSNQVAFIDDGLVVPGTGGSECITWCYGPSGYIVNTSGGLAGEGHYLHNYAVSPAMDWPDPAHDSMLIACDVYRHAEFFGGLHGVFYRLQVRSANEDAGQDIEQAEWFGTSNFFGEPDYVRHVADLSGLLVPGRTKVQIAVGAWDGGRIFNQPVSPDGTPAPYFDNIRVTTFPRTGPALAAEEQHLAQDTFPAAGGIDLSDLARNACRFDMALDITPQASAANDPGDSVVISVKVVRAGAALAGPPQMHWALDANPVFDSVRSASPPNPVDGLAAGLNRFSFDLPDSGFLFPGDRLHIYFSATDEVAGDPGTRQTNTLPADLTGFGDFSFRGTWPRGYSVHALPTVRSIDLAGGSWDQPPLLVWDHDRTGRVHARWRASLLNLSLVEGDQYDVFRTLAPELNVGNGLAGRAGLDAVAGYTDLALAAGREGDSVLAAEPYLDSSPDLVLLTDWLDLGGRDLLLSGDNLASDLARNQGPAGDAFLLERMGVEYVHEDASLYLGMDLNPVIAALPGNPVFSRLYDWVAYGACPDIRSFDAIRPAAGGVSAASLGGADGLSGAVLAIDQSRGNRVLTLPYDLARILPSAADKSEKGNAPPAARTYVLADILDYFMIPSAPIGPAPVPEVRGAGRLAVLPNEPNPFNPLTRIRYVAPREGHLSLRVYDLRGQLVRVLVDGPVAAGPGEAAWDGADDRGGAVSSGVYFYETRMGDDIHVGKMALVR